MSSGNGLDRLARELASGEISRRAALRRMAGAAFGAGLASVPGASAFASAGSKRCPSSRRCRERCCPKHAHCKRGRCRCNSGYTKCGKKCVDLKSDAVHCGDCDTACDPGRACVGGECQECTSADECPQPSDSCHVAACNQGFCSIDQRDDGDACDDGNQCTTGETCTGGVCGGGTPVTTGTACDQNGGAICNDQGACVPCTTNADCGGTSSPCGPFVCQSGACVPGLAEGENCGFLGCTIVPGEPGVRDLCCHNGTCSQVCSSCY